MDDEEYTAKSATYFTDLLKNTAVSKDAAKLLIDKYVTGQQPWTTAGYTSGGYTFGSQEPKYHPCGDECWCGGAEKNPCEEQTITHAPHHSDKGYNPDTCACACVCSKCSLIEQQAPLAQQVAEEKEALAKAWAEAKAMKELIAAKKKEVEDEGVAIAKEPSYISTVFPKIGQYSIADAVFPKTTIQSSSLSYVPDNTVWEVNHDYEVVSGDGTMIYKSDHQHGIFPVSFGSTPVEVGSPTVVQLPDGTEVFIPAGSALRAAVEGDDPDVDD